MCIIVDTNKIVNFFKSPQGQDNAPIHRWINEKGGVLVYSKGGKLGKEFNDVMLLLDEYYQVGKTTMVSLEKIESQEVILNKAAEHKSDDAHILALAKVSGARLLYTEDKVLMDDFRNKKIIDSPRGKIYSGVGNKSLLKAGLCK